VQNRNGSVVYSAPAATERYGGIINASDVVYDPEGTGAVATTVQTKLRESVSVLDFGAVGDGVANDTTAIQNAITAAQTSGSGVFLPAGNYFCGSTGLTISASIHLFGENGANIFFAAGFSGTGLTVNAAYVKLSNFVMSAPYSASIPTAIAIDVLQAHIVMFGVRVEPLGSGTYHGFNIGLRLAEYSHSIVSCTITAYQYGIYSNVANAVYLTGTGVSAKNSTSGAGILMSGGSGNSIQQCNVEGDSFAGIYLDDGGTVNSGTGSCAITGCYLEGQVNGIYILGSATAGGVKGLSINGNFISSSGLVTALNGIVANRVIGLAITGNTINGYQTSGITIGAAATDCLITANNISVVGTEQIINAAATGTFDTTGPNDEGTWTPVDASGASLTFTSPGGTYTKIGRMYFWQAALVYPSTANASNSLIGGLPAVIDAGVNSSGRSGGIVSVTDSLAVQLMQMDNTATVRPYKTGLVRATNADLSGTTLYLAGSFFVA
jgi:hypothetical protein